MRTVTEDTVNDLLSRSQVCRSTEQLFGVFERWRNATWSAARACRAVPKSDGVVPHQGRLGIRLGLFAPAAASATGALIVMSGDLVPVTLPPLPSPPPPGYTTRTNVAHMIPADGDSTGARPAENPSTTSLDAARAILPQIGGQTYSPGFTRSYRYAGTCRQQAATPPSRRNWSRRRANLGSVESGSRPAVRDFCKPQLLSVPCADGVATSRRIEGT